MAGCANWGVNWRCSGRPTWRLSPAFFTVLIIWVNHHAMFKLICRVNTRLLFANGLLLMMTTTVPFGTQLVALYLRTPAGKAACAVYGGIYVMTSMAYNFTWRSAIRRRALVSRHTSEEMIARINHTYHYGTPIYLLATAGAFVSGYITMGVCTAMWVFWAYTICEV